MSNPLMIAGAIARGKRRRARVGAEFVQCADGSWVGRQHIADCDSRGGRAGGGSSGVTGTPTYNRTPYTPPVVVVDTYNPPSVTPPNTPVVVVDTYNPPSVTPPNTPIVTSPPNNTPVVVSPPSGGGCSPVIPVCPENLKRYVMPFIPDAGFTVAVAAGTTARFVGKPQKMFKPDRLIIASTIAPYFDVVNFIIANVPQSLSQGNVPADIYSEVSTYTLMTFDQAYPGIDVILTVTNKSSVSQNFQATLVGEAIG